MRLARNARTSGSSAIPAVPLVVRYQTPNPSTGTMTTSVTSASARRLFATVMPTSPSPAEAATSPHSASLGKIRFACSLMTTVFGASVDAAGG